MVTWLPATVAVVLGVAAVAVLVWTLHVARTVQRLAATAVDKVDHAGVTAPQQPPAAPPSVADVLPGLVIVPPASFVPATGGLGANGHMTPQAFGRAVNRRSRVRGRHYGAFVALVSVVATLLVLGAAGGTAFIVLNGKSGKPVGKSKALDDYRRMQAGQADAGTTDTTPTTTLPADTTLPSGATTTTAPSSSGSISAGTTAATSSGTQPATTAPPTTVAGTGTVLRPPTGVYSYAGSGHANTNILGQDIRETIPSTVNATVTDHGSCWNETLNILTTHTETEIYCPEAGGLVDTGGSQKQSTLGQTVSVAITCNPTVKIVIPGMTVGQTWPASCDLQNSGADTSHVVSAGPTTYVGDESVSVGGTAVPAWRIRQARTISGGQTGQVTEDTWVAKSNGMLVKDVRDENITSKGVVRAAYTEQDTFTLKSMTPST